MSSCCVIQDYPSVGQISDALDVSKKHVIFAVVKGVLDVYEQVQKLVPRSSVNELKQGGDSNILSIVRDKYRVRQSITYCHNRVILASTSWSAVTYCHNGKTCHVKLVS